MINRQDMTKRTAAIAVALVTIMTSAFTATTSKAQSKSFSLGQWTEIQNAIIKELNNSYVDSLQVGRIYRAGIDAMLGSIDPYTIFIPEEENEDLQMMVSKTYGGVGAIIHKKKGENVVINEPYYNSPATKAGLVCGDEIMEIDGMPVKDLETAQCSERMKGKPGTKVHFKVKKLRTGDTTMVTIVRERIHLPDVEYSGMVNDTTGYILQSSFTENVSAGIREAYFKLKGQGMKRLVLDLRGNGGGLLGEAVNIVSLFVPKGSTVVTSRGNTPDAVFELKTRTEPVDLDIPLMVLVDGGSASASEIVSGAFQDLDRAVIVGTKTYGKGLVQSIRPLPYNGQMKVTTAKYYTPSGRCVQAIDYSSRNATGDAEHIPDSLVGEFKTKAGRIVKDAGGITPDIEIPFKKYSRLVYSLVLSGVVDTYSMEFVREHDAIASLDDFKVDDKIFNDFVEFAKTQEFDYRSGAKTLFDQMKKELEEDGIVETMSDELKALEKALEMDKEKFIRLKRNEIIPFIEEEIATRYYFQEAGVQIRLRYDDQLHKALAIPVSELKAALAAPVVGEYSQGQ